MEFGKFESLDGGLMFYALLGCLAALTLGAAWWALGHHSANPRTAGRGKVTLGAALLGALLVGGGPMLVDFFTKTGARIITANVDRSNGHIEHARISLIVQTFCTCAWHRAHIGEPIEVHYEVSNTGHRSVARVRARGNSGVALCPWRHLEPSRTVVCTAKHLITASDLAAGQFTAAGTATGVASDGTVLSTSANGQIIRLRT